MFCNKDYSRPTAYKSYNDRVSKPYVLNDNLDP